MGEINNPHDKFFKETLGNVSLAKDFIMHYLPAEILGIIELDTLQPQKDSFVAEDLKEYFSDLLFGVQINGLEGYLYFLFEHKSYQTKNISFQLLTYMVEIWESKLNKEENKELPLIIPIVIYHGREKWRIPNSLGDQFIGFHDLPRNIQHCIPDYEYLLYDFSPNGHEQIKGETELWLFLQILKNIFVKDVEQTIIVIERASTAIESNQSGNRFYNTLIRYILSAREDLSIEEVNERLPKEGRERFMSVADQLREEGEIKGIKKGREEVKSEIARKMLKQGMNEEEIMTLTGLSKNDIKDLMDNLHE